MRIAIIVAILLMLCGEARADRLGFPFPCHQKQLQKELAKEGIYIDETAFDRKDRSLGYFTDGMPGCGFVIETYYTVTTDELKDLDRIVRDHYYKNRARLWGR